MKDKSKFVRIKCPKCKKEHVIFGKASTKVKCISCKSTLIKVSGGKAKIKAQVKEVL